MTGFKFDKSGKLREPTAEEWKKADEEDAILSLSRGTAADGRRYYAFIAVTPSKYADYYRLSMQHKPFILDDYGTVIISEYLAEPPEDVLDWMAEDYDYDPDFQEKVTEQFQKEGAEFLSKGEDNRINDIVSMLKQKQANGIAQPAASTKPAAAKNGAAAPKPPAAKSGIVVPNAAAAKNGVVTTKTPAKPKTSQPEPEHESKSVWDRIRGK